MLKNIGKIALVSVFISLCVSGIVFAKPGPVIATLMERAEWNSNVRSTDPAKAGTLEDVLYQYTLLSLYRKLDENIFGNIFYMNKYDTDNSYTATHIGGVSIMRNCGEKIRLTSSYSYSSNPERNPVTSRESTSDRFSFTLNYKINPKEKAKPVFSLGTTFSTGTDFSFGRTLSEKLTIDQKIFEKWTYSASYQFVWGLTDAPDRGIYRTQFANQYELDLNRKIGKTQRISIGYFFLNNLYHGATTDNNFVRLSYYKTLQQK